MDFFRRRIRPLRPTLSNTFAQLAPSDSDKSFTNFPVNQDTKHPLRDLSSNSLASITVQPNKESIASWDQAWTHPGESSSLNAQQQTSSRMSVATPQQLTTLNETSFIGDSNLEGNYPQSKKLGLRRKLSKVKSLVDMRSALLAEHRKSSPRRSDVNVDESSFRANSPRSLKETRRPLTVMEEQETNESTFSSFIKRTMSSDSLMRKTSKKGARSLSPEVTLTPATLTSTAGITICPIPDEAMDSSRKVENTVELAPSGTAPAEVHAEEKTKRSAQSSGSFSHHIHTILPDKLPDITEETENKSVDMSRDHSMVSIQVQVLNHSEQVERATRSTTVPSLREDKKSKGDSRAQNLTTSDRVQRDKLPSAIPSLYKTSSTATARRGRVLAGEVVIWRGKISTQPSIFQHDIKAKVAALSVAAVIFVKFIDKAGRKDFSLAHWPSYLTISGFRKLTRTELQDMVNHSIGPFVMFKPSEEDGGDEAKNASLVRDFAQKLGSRGLMLIYHFGPLLGCGIVLYAIRGRLDGPYALLGNCFLTSPIPATLGGPTVDKPAKPPAQTPKIVQALPKPVAMYQSSPSLKRQPNVVSPPKNTKAYMSKRLPQIPPSLSERAYALESSGWSLASI